MKISCNKAVILGFIISFSVYTVEADIFASIKKQAGNAKKLGKSGLEKFKKTKTTLESHGIDVKKIYDKGREKLEKGLGLTEEEKEAVEAVEEANEENPEETEKELGEKAEPIEEVEKEYKAPRKLGTAQEEIENAKAIAAHPRWLDEM